MANDKTFSQSGAFTVLRVDEGTYDNVILDASNGGSIHVLGKLTVNGTLTIKASSSATVLLPAQVKCQKLVLTSTHSSTINSNDLEVLGIPDGTPEMADPCTFNLDHASTCGLYMVNYSGISTGSVKSSSTLNLYVDFPNDISSDSVVADHTSLYTMRGWTGPTSSQATTSSAQPAAAGKS